MPNLIVIIFNLIYPVFYMRFICKGCVWERVCEDSRQLKTKVVFAGSSRVSFLRRDACAQHITGMRKVKTGWRQLVFMSVTRIRHSRKILAKTSCHQLVLTLRILVMCRAHASLRRKLTRELPLKTALVFNCLESSHFLSHTQPLQWHPTK